MISAIIGASFSLFTHRRWRGRAYLISPAVDFLMVGGLALLIVPLLLFVIPPRFANGEAILPYSVLLGALVVNHIFFINYPHFAASYQLMYRNFSSKFRGENLPLHLHWRYVFAGVVFPILFIAYVAYAFAAQKLVLLGYLVNFMFLTVGWHYCKQAFGTLMVLSALKGIYYAPWQRRLFLGNANLVWMVTWFGSNIAVYENQFWGLPYHSIALQAVLPAWFGNVDVLYWQLRGTLFWVALLLAAVVLVKAWHDKVWPSLTAWVGYVTMYGFVLLVYDVHPFWLFIIPAFHSLQYLLFVVAYKRNECEALARREGASAAGASKKSIYFFLSLAVLIGAVQFEWGPRLADRLVADAYSFALPTLFLAIGQLFFNIHHYFIDNVIWRKDNPGVMATLLAKPA